MQKLLVLTASKDTLSWQSLSNKLAYIKSILNTGNGANFTVDIQYTPAIPKITGERIDHTWLNDLIRPHFNNGYDFICFHFSEKQKNAWGIRPSLRGSNPDTDDEMGDFWISADEHTERLGFNRFEQVLLHELAHEFFQETNQKDITHEYHDKHKNIAGLYSALDWTKYQPRRMALKKQKNLLETIVAALKARLAAKKVTTLLHPVEKYRKLISQEYGVVNANFYPQTGHHIGTDYACPVGTPVLAPWNGEVIISGTSPALGNFCHYKYTFDGVTYVARLMHLSDVPTKAKYKRGELIELSGKTGKITGPHLHVDLWYNDVRLDLLTAKNWMNLTIDPQKHYA